MIGDVIFFRKENTFISSVIAKVTNSEFTHVGLIIGYDEATKVATIIESNRFVDTRIDRIELDELRHVVYTTGDKSQSQIDRILEYANRTIGIKYDYLQIIGFLFTFMFKSHGRKWFSRWFNSKNKLICSELIDLVYYKAGIKRNNVIDLGNVTPQELLQVYDFRLKKED